MTSTYSSISKDAFAWPTTETEAALKRIRELEQKRLQYRSASSSNSLDAGTRLSRRQQLSGSHRIGARKSEDGHEDRRSTILVRRRIHENVNPDIDRTLSMSHGRLDTTESYQYGGARPKHFELSSPSKHSFLPQRGDNYMRERSSSLTNSGENESISLFRSQSVTGLPSGEMSTYEISLGRDDSNLQTAESTVNTSISEDEEDIENFKRSLLGIQNLANVPEREEPVLQSTLPTFTKNENEIDTSSLLIQTLPTFTRNENEINTSSLLIQPVSQERTYTHLRCEKKIENILNDSMKQFDKIFEAPKFSNNISSTLPRSQRPSSRFDRLSQNSRLSSSSGSSYHGGSRDGRRVFATGRVESSEDFLSRHQRNIDNIKNRNISDNEQMLKTDTLNLKSNILNETSEINVGNIDRNSESQDIPAFSNTLHTENEKTINENIGIGGTDAGQINLESDFSSGTIDPKEIQTYSETSDNSVQISEHSLSVSEEHNTLDSARLIENDEETVITSESMINDQRSLCMGKDLDIQMSLQLNKTDNDKEEESTKGDDQTIVQTVVSVLTDDHVPMQISDDHMTMQTDNHMTMQSDDNVTMLTDDHIEMQTSNQRIIQTEEGHGQNSTSEFDDRRNGVENLLDVNKSYASLVMNEMEDDLVDASNVNFFETFNNQDELVSENIFDSSRRNETDFPHFSSTTDFLNYDQNIRYGSVTNGSIYERQNYDTFPSRSQRSLSLDHQSHFKTRPYSVNEEDRPSSRTKSFQSKKSEDVFSRIDQIFDQRSKLKELESKLTRPRARDSLTSARRVTRTRSDAGGGTTYGNRYNKSSLRRTFTNAQNDNNSTYFQGSYGTSIDRSRYTDSYQSKWRRGGEENTDHIYKRDYTNVDSQHRTSVFDRSKSLDLTPSYKTDGYNYFYNSKSDNFSEKNDENIVSEIGALASEISTEFVNIQDGQELNDTLNSQNVISETIQHAEEEKDNTEILDEELTFTSSCQVELGKVLVCATENIKTENTQEVDENLNIVSSDNIDIKSSNEKHLSEQSDINNIDKDAEKISSADNTADNKPIDNNSVTSSSSKRKKNKKKGKKGSNSDNTKIIVSHPSEILAREKKAKKESKDIKDKSEKSEKVSVTEEKSDNHSKGLLSSISNKPKKQTVTTIEKSPKKSEKQTVEKKSPEKEVKQTNNNTNSPKSPSKLKNLFDSIIHALDHKSETSSSTASIEDNKSQSSGEKTPVADEWEIISEPSSELNIIHEDNYATFTDEDIGQEKRRLSDEISGMSTDNYETASDHTISGESEYEEFYEALPTELITAWSENELLMETERKEKFVYVCAESKVRRKKKNLEYNVGNVGDWISNNLYPGEKYPEKGENVANLKFNEQMHSYRNGSNENSVIIQTFKKQEESSESLESQPIEINNHTSNQLSDSSTKIDTELLSAVKVDSVEMITCNEGNSTLTNELRPQKSLQDELPLAVKTNDEQNDLKDSTTENTNVLEKATSMQFVESLPTENIQFDLKASDSGFTDTLVNNLKKKLCSSCQGVLLDVLKQTYFARYEEISKINLTEPGDPAKSSVKKDQKSETMKVNNTSDEIRLSDFPKSHVGKKLKIEDLLYGDSKDQEVNSVDSVRKNGSERNKTVGQTKTEKSKGTETVNQQKSKSRETTPTKSKGKLSISDKSFESSTSVQASPRKNSVEIKIKGKTVSMDKNKKEEKISPKSEQKLCRQNGKTGKISENGTKNGTIVNTEDQSDETGDNEEFRLPMLKNNPFIKSDKLRTSARNENREKKNDKSTKTVVSKSKQFSDSTDQSAEGAKSSKSPSPDGKVNNTNSSPTRPERKSGSRMKQDSKSRSPIKQDSKSSSTTKSDSKSNSPVKQDSKSNSPAKIDINLSSPTNQDINLSSPTKQDSKTLANGIGSSKSSSSGEQEGEAVTNGIDSDKSNLPGTENTDTEKTVDSGKDNNGGKVRKTSLSGSKKPSMFDHLNFAKTVCEGLGPAEKDMNKDKNTETVNKLNKEESPVQKKTKTPTKKKKFSPFGGKRK